VNIQINKYQLCKPVIWTKKVTINSTQVQLSIWDTAGQERFHALGPIYYRDAAGALLVYDITDQQSFDKVKNWVKELKKIVGNDIVIVIAGNKIDMEKNRHVNNSEAESYAASVGAAHFQTSAKTNRGLDDVFNHLASRMLDKKPTTGRGSVATPKQKLVIVDEPVQAQKKSGCC
jgi:Ras-related protein Rab-21